MASPSKLAGSHHGAAEAATRSGVSKPSTASSGKEIERALNSLDRIAAGLETASSVLQQIAGLLAPEPNEVVGTPYVAERIGCTAVWVAEMARNGKIPTGCIVKGSGNGKPWKFYRGRIEEWLDKR